MNDRADGTVLRHRALGITQVVVEKLNLKYKMHLTVVLQSATLLQGALAHFLLHCLNLLQVLVEDVLSNKLRTFELLATERTEVLVL